MRKQIAPRAPSIATSLQRCTNVFGPLDLKIQKRLRALIQHPTEARWDDAHGIILSDAAWLTLWQAVRLVDPTFPNIGPVERQLLSGRPVRISTWPRVPDALLLVRAIRHALTLKPGWRLTKGQR